MEEDLLRREILCWSSVNRKWTFRDSAVASGAFDSN
jgi:hypothetical protein